MSRKIVGGRPGYRKLLKQVKEAETNEDALHLLFSSDVLTHEEKQLFLEVQVYRALGSSPLRNMMKKY